MVLACADDPSPNDYPHEDVLGPTLEAANFELGGASLILRFSEPVVVPEGIDPSNFRISLAMHEYFEETTDEPAWGSSDLWDPNFRANGGSLNVVGVSSGAEANEVVLEFDVPIDPTICALIHERELEFAEYGDKGVGQIGLLAHYGIGGPEEPYLEDLEGIAASSFGADWVWFDGFHSEHASEYLGEALDSEIEIPCVF